MFVFEAISHSFAGRSGELVLAEISLTIEKGECVGLTGPSGCGKSTLGQIGAGFLTPSRGRVLVEGDDVTGRPSRKVALIHQDSDLFPWLRVAKQIQFAQKKADRRRVKELIELVQLQGFERHFPHQLSGGMKKRLALARGLAMDPRLIILDESFSSLDGALKSELFGDLRRIWQRTKTTILLITHDPHDLENLVHREVRLTPVRPTRISEIVVRKRPSS